MNGVNPQNTNSNILPFPSEHTGAQREGEQEQRDEAWSKAREGKLKKRFYAFFTDLFIIGLLQKTLVYSYVTFVTETFTQAPVAVRKNLLANVGDLRLSTLLVTFFSYFLVSYFMGHGKTIGKTIFNLRVLSHEGAETELSLMEAFMRTLGYTTCYATGSFLFGIVFLRKDGRGIPDFFSQTEVITDEEMVLHLKEIQEDKERLEKHSLEQIDHQFELFAS